jgi:hypothetical protein
MNLFTDDVSAHSRGRPTTVCQNRRVSGVSLDFLNRNGARRANLNTGIAPEAFFRIHGHGLAILHFIYFNGADIHTFVIAGTFVGINRYVPAHVLPPMVAALFNQLFLFEKAKQAVLLFLFADSRRSLCCQV